MRAPIAIIAVMTSVTIARAQRPPEPLPPEPATPETSPSSDPPAIAQPAIPEDLAGRLEELEDKTRKLERLARDGARAREQVTAMSWLPRFITVFVDVGAFAVGGDGSGIRSDSLHIHYPQYRNTVSGQWVFMGDPFSTAINSLGEPADTSNSRENTSDTINSEGRPSVIVNALGLGINKAIAGGVSITALAELLPRPGPDQLDVPLAHIDYRPSDEIDLVISAGKIDSVLGIEYRTQDAPRRLGVTPSLICRYTCGRPLGIEARLVRGRWSTSAAITNGDSFDDRFAPGDQLKANKLPTLSGHVQWMLPLGRGLEVGVSGMVGPQDDQPSLSIHQWHYGFDAKLRDFGHWSIAAELVQGKQQGSTSGDPAQDRMLGFERPSCDLAQCLSYKGAYVLVDRRINAWLTPYIRLDWRDAVLEKGADFVYESHTLRTTLGVHLEITSRVVGKIEYAWIREGGAFTLTDVPPGSYKVVGWVRDSREVKSDPFTVTAGATTTLADELHLQAGKARVTHTRKDGSPYPPY